MTFDWNSSSEFENGHHRSNATLLNRGFMPPGKMFVDTITLERLNRSEPNFHTWLLTGIARPSSKMGIAGHIYANPPNWWLLPSPQENSNDNSWKAQPIRTKFSHMTFDWNSSAKVENRHRRSHITPLIEGLCPPENSNTSDFHKFNLYILATK